MASGSAGRWMRWKMRNKNPLTAPHPRIPVWARRLKTLRPADSEHPPESVHPPTQSSPKTVGRPTFATRGYAPTRRGRQQAIRCHRVGISGHTRGDTGSKRFNFYCRGDGSPQRHSACREPQRRPPPPDGSPKAFSFSPIFLFHARKRKMGCGRLTGTIGVRGTTPHPFAKPR